MRNVTNNLTLILLMGCIIRVLLAFSFDTGDTGAFCLASTRFLQKQEVYNAPDIYYSGPPFALHLTAFTNFLGQSLHLPCEGMWKMPAVLCDIGIGYLIYFISRKKFSRSKKQAKIMTMWYIFNPISVFISGFHGQQDPFWVFFILLSWLLLDYYKNYIVSAVFAGIAVAYKLPAILLLPGIFLLVPKWKNKLIWSVIVVGLFGVSLLPEIITSQQGVIKQSFLYSSTPNVWGWTRIATLLLSSSPETKVLASTLVSKILKLILVLALGTYYLKTIQKDQFDFLQISVDVIAIWYVFTPGFGTQYLFWLLPFLVLKRNPLTFLYTIFVSFAFFHTYGLNFAPTNLILHWLQQHLYYKSKILYPYDLYFPVWILSFFLLFHKERALLEKIRALLKNPTRKAGLMIAAINSRIER